MATQDPFERAAKREQIEEARRAAMGGGGRRSWWSTYSGMPSDGGGARKAFRAFFLPYLVWALLRAANHPWADPWDQSVIDYFFHTGFWFAAASLMVFTLLWVSAIGPDDDD